MPIGFGGLAARMSKRMVPSKAASVGSPKGTALSRLNPKNPNIQTAVNAQTDANRRAAIDTQRFNQLTQVGPGGSITYRGRIGSPNRRQITTLDPGSQRILDRANAHLGGAPPDRSPLGAGVDPTIVSRLRAVQGVDKGIASRLRGDRSTTSGLPQLAGEGSYGSETERAGDVLFQRGLNRVSPEFDRQRNQLHTRLANQGIPVNSEAYNTAMNRLDDSQGRQISDLGLSSAIRGSEEHQRLADLTSRNRGQYFGERNRMFDEALGMAGLEEGQDARQFSQVHDVQRLANDVDARAFQQRLAAAQFGLAGKDQDLRGRAQSLAERMQVMNPTFRPTTPVGINSPDVLGFLGNLHASKEGARQASKNRRSSTLGSLIGGAGAILGGIFSDERMKTDATRVGALDDGTPVHTYRYKDGGPMQMGVMAQELMKRKPKAVGRDPLSGMMTVDYARV